jgi:GT2 family glycosyltransferase
MTEPTTSDPAPAEPVESDPGPGFAADGLDALLEPLPDEVVDPHADRTVAAVLVAHDGMDWLETALEALRGQERPVDNIVVVDTGSVDGGGAFARSVLGEAGVVTVPRATGFGAAVAAGVDVLGPSDWLWILHDDSAPRPDALLHLLDAGESRIGVGAVGPKVLGWAHRTRLLEVGITIGRGGKRYTGVDRDERDQGQHDRERDVLAVGSAGLLVRRSTWDRMGGFDPALAMFRDDLDLGWRITAAGERVIVVPRAVVHHAEAATHRRRSAEAVGRHPRRADRAHAVRVLLAHAPGWALPFVLIALVVASLARSLAFLLGKDGVAAGDEIAALATVLGSPGTVLRMRRSRRTDRAGRAAVAALRPSWSAQTREAIEAGLDLLPGGDDDLPVLPVDAGGDPDLADLSDYGSAGPGRVRRWLSRPGVVLGLALVMGALVAGRDLLGPGRLVGGALLPAPGGASDWWQSATASWHAVAVGSTIPAPATTSILAAAATILLGKPGVVLDLLLLLAVPAAFTSATLALRGIVRSRGLRLWAATAYSLLPPVTLAIGQGRVGTVVVAILLPALLRAGAHLIGADPSPPGPRAAWGTALLVAVVGAFVPVLWLALALVGAVAAWRADRATRVRIVIALAVPWLLWLPWSWQLLTTPSTWLLESGAAAPGLADPALPPWSLLGLNPGGSGALGWWWTVGVVLVALAGLVRRGRRSTILACWSAAGVLLVAALLQSWVRVTPVNGAAVVGWSGPLVLAAGALLLVAGAVGSEGAWRRLSVTSFSARQVGAGLVALAAAMAPLAAGAAWTVGGAGGPVVRDDGPQLPLFVAQQASGPERPRTLVLADESGRIGYTLVSGPEQTTGQAEVSSTREQLSGLDAVVADIVSGRGGPEAAGLRAYGVRYVLVRAPVPDALAARLDAAPGLARVASPDGGALWRLGGTTARVRLVPERGAVAVVPSGPVEAAGQVPKGWTGGRVVLADSADGGWRATLDDVDLAPVTATGGLQAFELPAGASGTVRVERAGSARLWWNLLAGVVAVAVVVLALPSRRHDDSEGEDA